MKMTPMLLTVAASISLGVSAYAAQSPFALDGGYKFNVALKSEGTVWAWGYNYELGYGNGRLGLGDGVTSYTEVPVQVLADDDHNATTPAVPLSHVVQISVSISHALALKDDGTVWAWGDDGSGEGGQNAVGGYHAPAVQVLGIEGVGYLDNIVAIAAAAGHSLALTNDGRVLAWGDNRFGQLGSGVSTLFSHPVPTYVKSAGGVADLSSIVSIAAAQSSSFALTSSGTVLSWGTNAMGVMGRGTTIVGPFPEPEPVVDAMGIPISGITTLVAPGYSANLYAAAMDNQGHVWTWGHNAITGNTDYSAVLMKNQSNELVGGYSKLVAGYMAPCAIRADNTAEIWRDMAWDNNRLRTDFTSPTSPLVEGVAAISCRMADVYVTDSGAVYSLTHLHLADRYVLGHTDVYGWDVSRPVNDASGTGFKLFEGVASTTTSSTTTTTTTTTSSTASTSSSGGGGSIDYAWLMAGLMAAYLRRKSLLRR